MHSFGDFTSIQTVVYGIISKVFVTFGASASCLFNKVSVVAIIPCQVYSLREQW